MSNVGDIDVYELSDIDIRPMMISKDEDIGFRHNVMKCDLVLRCLSLNMLESIC